MNRTKRAFNFLLIALALALGFCGCALVGVSRWMLERCEVGE